MKSCCVMMLLTLKFIEQVLLIHSDFQKPMIKVSSWLGTESSYTWMRFAKSMSGYLMKQK